MNGKDERKTKSQCFSKQNSGERKTTATSKITKTARLSGDKRGGEKGQNYLKGYEQLQT